MKKLRRILPLILSVALLCTCIPAVAKADGSKVVTIGADLSSDQKNSMYEYFGTNANEVETITVTNQDERKYMEGIASEAEIGRRAISCSYVEPTTSGGIQVKVANLTYVTSSMIASTLLTSGMENCNVVAAAPFEVSGTGALTGIMMAYETASGETLSEDQKETATEELVTTGELADEIGQDEATDLINDVKEAVIEDDLKDADSIENAVNEAADSLNITLTDDQMNKIVSLMEQISQYDYDVNALKETLNNLSSNGGNFFTRIFDSIKNFFTGNSSGGILNDTNEAALGSGVVIDSTLGSSGSGESLWERIVNFFKDLFGGNEEEKTEEAEEPVTQEETEETPSENTTSGTNDNSSDNSGGITVYSEDTETFTTEDNGDVEVTQDSDTDASGTESNENGNTNNETDANNE